MKDIFHIHLNFIFHNADFTLKNVLKKSALKSLV